MNNSLRRCLGFALTSSIVFSAVAQIAREKRVAPVESAARQSFERQPKVAVVVGVGQYSQHSGLSALRFPAKDADLVATELTRQGYKVVALKDQDATRGSIEQALHDASELVDHGAGTVLFFFSGHGFADRGANYLATFEASSSDLATSGIPVAHVEELLKATGAPRSLMFIDACRSEVGKTIGARSFDRLEGAAGLRVLLSTKAGRISYEDEHLGSGVFTHFLVRGLQGEAAGADGSITFRDLADYVTDEVSTYGFQHGQLQVPYEAGEASGDFLLATTKGISIAVEPSKAKANFDARPVNAVTVADFAFEVRGCSVRGGMVTCSLQIMTAGPDSAFLVCVACSGYGQQNTPRIVDDKGNEYVAKLMKVGNQVAGSPYSIDVMTQFASNVPMAASIQFADLSPEASTITLLEFLFDNQRRYPQKFKVQFRNIPVQR